MENSFLILIISGLVAFLVLISLNWHIRSMRFGLVMFSCAVAVWALFGFSLLGSSHPNLFLWGGLRMLSLNFVAVTFYIVALAYSGQGLWRLTWPKFILLISIPLISQFLYWTDSLGGFPYAMRDVVVENTISSARLWYLISIVYSLLLMGYTAFILFQVVLRSDLTPKRKYITWGASLVPLLAVVAVGFVQNHSHTAIDWLVIILAGLGMTIILTLFALHALDFIPIARTTAIDSMNDGWMVLDKQNRIVDLNPSASSIVNLPREEILGHKAEDILSNWENLFQTGNVKEQEFRGSVKIKEGWKYFSVRISPLVGPRENEIGKIIFWRDITERRRADEARQRARDEMFVLLHSISGAASRALDLKDFLTEVIRQIVYSFHSQASLVYLLDEINAQDEVPRLVLAAQYGLAERDANLMSSIDISDSLVAPVCQTLEPMLLSDLESDPTIPDALRKQDYQSLLIIPMAIDGHLVGIIGLARDGETLFSADEITRMNIVADEIAAYVYTNRQRQLAIAVAERQRLVRDLHDSVTQKLYGLVALTEAAQAGLEAGSDFEPKQVLARIGVYARQALKEMRLFLYELQPVDLEHEGLVAALHQRLAAVEGRSDIKAGLLADEIISLNLEKQIALYFVTQEALNNILRHADAKSVTVRLKQGKTNVNLDIVDDGCGFDPKKVDNGGLGLKNMRERVLQIGGKIKINSSPGHGTKIKVTVRKDRS